jgi:PST family polysaccharide transporter
MIVLRRGLRAIRHPVSQNALALNAVQAANLVVPLVTLPYVSRVLGSDGFGLVVFAQSLSFVLGLIIAWGFDVWASRDVAVMRDDRGRLSVLVAEVMGARLILAASALVVAAGVLVTSPTTERSPEFVAMAWLAAASYGLSPVWFFLGIERLRLVSALALGFRVLAAAMTFVLVHHRSDAWIVMALFAGSAVLAAVVNIGLLFRRVDVLRPKLRPSLSAIRRSTKLFAGSAGITLYTAMNVVLLGFLGTRTQVAHFGAAERIIRACMQLLTPVLLAMYPRVTYLKSSGDRRAALRLLFTGAAVVVPVALVGAGLVFLLAPLIIRTVYGPGFGEAAAVMRVMAPIMPISTVTLVSMTWLMATRMDTRIMQITLAGGILNMALAPVLVHLAGARGMATSVLCAEVAVVTLALLASTRGRSRPGDDEVVYQDPVSVPS